MTTDELIVKLTNEKIFKVCIQLEIFLDYIDKNDSDYVEIKSIYDKVQAIYFKRSSLE